MEKEKYTVERTHARVLGLKWYHPKERCNRCGFIADRRVEDNRCSGCYPETDKTPRQIAMMWGKKWYRPKKPCPHCGLRARKLVSNNKCPGCALRDETWIMMKNAPDMVISSNDARKLKLQVYRTGEPCRNGHMGFKMISTNDCIDCITKRRKRNVLR